MEQSPKIQKIFSDIIDLINCIGLYLKFCHVSVDLVSYENKYVVTVYYAR